MDNEELNSQDVEVQKVEQVGEEKPQVEELTEEKPLGTEAKPPRTYTQDEWSKRESAKDKEIAQIRNQVAQLAVQAEVRQIQHAEAIAKARDQRDVDEGTITTSEASQREQARQQATQQQMTVAQQQQQLRQMSLQTEQYGRVLAAQDFGKEYELSQEQITELLKDEDIRTPGDMKAKAATLAYEREREEKKKSKETPKYDQGQKGGGETSTPEKALKDRYPSMYKTK